MSHKGDIVCLEDVQLLVNQFYAKVREDELLKNVFNAVIEDCWDEHLNKMYRFWETVLLGNHTYYGSPFMPHAQLEVELAHFERWLTLFNQTVSQSFIGENAEKAKAQGARMAELFYQKNKYFRALRPTIKV